MRLDDPRTDQLRIACLLLVACTGEHGDRLVTLLRADVAMQARQRRLLPALRDARVEQVLEAAEHRLPEIEERQRQLPTQLQAVLLVARGADENVEVAADQRIGRSAAQLLELGDRRPEIRLLALEDARLEIEHFGVVTFDTERGGALGVVTRHDVEQDLRVTIALFDPARLGRERSRRGERDDQYRSSKHGSSPQAWRQIGKLVRC